MARIKVLGGTGFAGEAVAREAASRGHTVTSYSRRPPSDPVDGVEYVTGSLLDPELLAQTVQNADVVFETVSPRGDMEGRLEEIVDQLISLADNAQCATWCAWRRVVDAGVRGRPATVRRIGPGAGDLARNQDRARTARGAPGVP